MNKMLRLQGLIELLGIGLFLVGFFTDTSLVMMAGGLIMAADDAMSMLSGALNPFFPALLAVVFAVLFTPWWLGVFWSLAVFKLWDVRASVEKLLAPGSVRARLE